MDRAVKLLFFASSSQKYSKSAWDRHPFGREYIGQSIVKNNCFAQTRKSRCFKLNVGRSLVRASSTEPEPKFFFAKLFVCQEDFAFERMKQSYCQT